MAGGVFGALASGVESGFNMGMRADEAAENKRRVKASEARADEEMSLRRTREAREDARATRTDNRQARQDAEAALIARRGEIENLSVAARTANQPIDPARAAEYGKIDEDLSDLRQQSRDFWSRAQAGQVDPLAASPAELYTNTAVALGRKPEELPAVQKGIKDIEAGLETGNQGLVVQGANQLLAPLLRRGVGTPSPYGGVITRKEIIGLDPARGGDGRDHPEKVIPRLRVYVEGASPDGKELFYDAPMSKGGATDDAPVAIDLARAMDWMGNLGVLAEAVQRPDVAAKMAEGSKAAGPRVQQYLDLLTQLGDAKKPKATVHSVPAGGMVAAFSPTGEVLSQVKGPEKTATPETPLKAALTASQIDLNKARAQKARGTGAGAAPASPALAGAPAPSGVGEDAVDFWARAVIAGDKDWQVGLGRSKSGSTLIEAVKRRVPQLAKEMGLEPQDIGTTRAQSAALAATMKDLTKRSEAVELFSSKVAKDMVTLDAELDKAALDSPLLINKPINALRRAFSDPALSRLDLAAKQVGAEYERLITGGTLSVAQLHVGAAEDAKKLINGDMTPKQARAVMDIMRTEMQNARDAAHESEARIRDRMRGLGRPAGTGESGGTPTRGTGLTPQPAAAGMPPAAALKEGQVTTFANGQRWTLQGGKPVRVQ